VAVILRKFGKRDPTVIGFKCFHGLVVPIAARMLALVRKKLGSTYQSSSCSSNFANRQVARPGPSRYRPIAGQSGSDRQSLAVVVGTE
jgi:hypothetical protein